MNSGPPWNAASSASSAASESNSRSIMKTREPAVVVQATPGLTPFASIASRTCR
jgi:hypothetical protein